MEKIKCVDCPYFCINEDSEYCSYYCQFIDRIILLGLCSWIDKGYDYNKM